jgi:hypothetical protein
MSRIRHSQHVSQHSRLLPATRGDLDTSQEGRRWDCSHGQSPSNCDSLVPNAAGPGRTSTPAADRGRCWRPRPGAPAGWSASIVCDHAAPARTQARGVTSVGTARLVTGSAAGPPFGDGESSAVTAIFAPVGLAEAFRVLPPGGRFVLADNDLRKSPSGPASHRGASTGGPRPSASRRFRRLLHGPDRPQRGHLPARQLPQAFRRAPWGGVCPAGSARCSGVRGTGLRCCPRFGTTGGCSPTLSAPVRPGGPGLVCRHAARPWDPDMAQRCFWERSAPPRRIVNLGHTSPSLPAVQGVRGFGDAEP